MHPCRVAQQLVSGAMVAYIMHAFVILSRKRLQNFALVSSITHLAICVCGTLRNSIANDADNIHAVNECKRTTMLLRTSNL